MGMLIDQLIDACREWCDETREPEKALTFYIMNSTGGTANVEAVGKVDPESVPEERREMLKAGEVMGYHTLRQTREWLETLAYSVYIFEDFLVISVIREIERQFEGLSEEYAKGIRRARETKEELEETLRDSRRLQDLIQRMNEAADRRPSPFRRSRLATAADVQAMAETMARFSLPSLDEQRRRRRYLDIWRQVTKRILASENLEEGRRDFFRRLGVEWA